MNDRQSAILEYMRGCPDVPQATAERYYERLEKAILEKNPTELLAILSWSRNRWSRGVFKMLTSITLPKTISGTREALRQYIGPQEFDEYRKAQQEAYDARRKAEEDNRLAERRKMMLAERIAWREGESLRRVECTVDGLLDYLVSQCVTYAEVKQGISSRYYINIQDGRSVKLSRKDMFEEFRFRLALKNAGIQDEPATVQ